MRLNRSPARRPRANAPRTHEGAPAAIEVGAEMELERSVLALMLWEDTFYETGNKVVARIEQLAGEVTPRFLAGLSKRARREYKLRHAPLLLLAELVKHGRDGSSLVQNTIAETIGRPDELGELLAIYWRKGKQPIAKQLQKGLARAFEKFDPYQLKKWNRDAKISLRDVLFLAHAKPTPEMVETFRQIAEKETKVAGTWEADLSAGKEKKTKADKKTVWETKLKSGKLGYMALLKNLRNMVEAGVERRLVADAILARRGADKVLPFRFVSAARHAPTFARELDVAFAQQIADIQADSEMTVVLVDVSYSMCGEKVSKNSELDRLDAAAALALMVPGRRRIFTFSNDIVEVMDVAGLNGMSEIRHSQANSGTRLGHAVTFINDNIPHDRLIVITDEQSADRVDPPRARGYMINVGTYEYGIGYGDWVHIDGFSEATLRFIAAYETKYA